MNTLRFLRRSFVLLICLSFFIGLFFILYLEAKLPSIETLKDVHLKVPLKIYSRDNKLIAEFGNKRRSPILYEEVPQKLIQAILSTEDVRFYQHRGVDLKSLLRAFVTLVSTGHKEQGGSTITMQVARNFFLTRHKSYIRKINEILLALKIEQQLTKEEILALYLNKIYFGKSAYGIGAAAKVYYGKTVQELTLPQMAMLAGIPQAPSTINPLYSSKAALKRRAHVLSRMRYHNHISQVEYEQALKTPLSATYHPRKIELHAPHIAETVRQLLVERFGEEVYELGYEVYTTIDSQLQQYANEVLVHGLLEYEQRHRYRGHIGYLTWESDETPAIMRQRWLNNLESIEKYYPLQAAATLEVKDTQATLLLATGKEVTLNLQQARWIKNESAKMQDLLKKGDVIYCYEKDKQWHLSQLPEVEGALVAMQPDTGEVLAMVGGYNHRLSAFNRAVQASRQPGSAFKPFVFASAMEHGFTPASIVNDAPIVASNDGEIEWRPKNHTLAFQGPTRLRVGLAKSSNLVTIRLLKQVGLEKTLDFLERCGFDREAMPKGLSLALGTSIHTPLELTARFCTFPNGGHAVDPFFVQKISNYQDDIFYEAEAPNLEAQEPDISPLSAYLTTSMMQSTITEGTGRKAKVLKRNDLSLKTGTSQNQVDAWTVGFNRDLVVGTWIGFDEPKSLKEYASKASLPTWIAFMKKALANKPEHAPIQPAGLTHVLIDPKTGLLAHPEQEDGMYELFPESLSPTEHALSPQQAMTTPYDSTDDVPSNVIESLF